MVDGVAGRGEILKGALSCCPFFKNLTSSQLLIVILVTIIEGSGLLLEASDFGFD